MLNGATFPHVHNLERLSLHCLTGSPRTCPPKSRCSTIAVFDQILDDNGELVVTTPGRVDDLSETSGAMDLLTLKALMVDVLVIHERRYVIDLTAVEGSNHR